jgi:hypothetical protein
MQSINSSAREQGEVRNNTTAADKKEEDNQGTEDHQREEEGQQGKGAQDGEQQDEIEARRLTHLTVLLTAGA